MSKTIVIYHSLDLDGWMSAAIVKRWYAEHVKVGKFNTLDALEFLGYNYGQAIPDLSEYSEIIMCDISFPKEEMEKIANKLIWIDHHISAIKTMDESEQFNSQIKQRFTQTNYAACELTWFHFFPNKTIPELVRLLGRYDCFGHKNTNEETKVLEFQYGARTIISNYEEAYKELTECLTYFPESGYPTREGEILGMGKAVYSFLCTDAKQSYKNGFELELTKPHDTISDLNQVFKFICINKERFNPINFGIDYHSDGYDGAACFHIDKDGIFCFSLYNDNGLVDCSQIAKTFGGGGHKGVAGFRLTLQQFNNLITK